MVHSLFLPRQEGKKVLKWNRQKGAIGLCYVHNPVSCKQIGGHCFPWNESPGQVGAHQQGTGAGDEEWARRARKENDPRHFFFPFTTQMRKAV